MWFETTVGANTAAKKHTFGHAIMYKGGVYDGHVSARFPDFVSAIGRSRHRAQWLMSSRSGSILPQKNSFSFYAICRPMITGSSRRRSHCPARLRSGPGPPTECTHPRGRDDG